jgi:hypothetical protein
LHALPFSPKKYPKPHTPTKLFCDQLKTQLSPLVTLNDF